MIDVASGRRRRVGVCFRLLGCIRTPQPQQSESFAVASVFPTGLHCFCSSHTGSRHNPLLPSTVPAVLQQCQALTAVSPHHQRKTLLVPALLTLLHVDFGLWATTRLGKSFSALLSLSHEEHRAQLLAKGRCEPQWTEYKKTNAYTFLRLPQTWCSCTGKKKKRTTKSCSFAPEKEETGLLFGFSCFSPCALLQCHTDKFYL